MCFAIPEPWVGCVFFSEQVFVNYPSTVAFIIASWCKFNNSLQPHIHILMLTDVPRLFASQQALVVCSDTKPLVKYRLSNTTCSNCDGTHCVYGACQVPRNMNVISVLLSLPETVTAYLLCHRFS